jgi:hypothetical protein
MFNEIYRSTYFIFGFVGEIETTGKDLETQTYQVVTSNEVLHLVGL